MPINGSRDPTRHGILSNVTWLVTVRDEQSLLTMLQIPSMLQIYFKARTGQRSPSYEMRACVTTMNDSSGGGGGDRCGVVVGFNHKLPTTVFSFRHQK